MQQSAKTYRDLVAQGWAGMLFLLLTMLIADIIELAMQGDYGRTTVHLLTDPGIVGLWFLSCLICVNVLAQMAIRATPENKYRTWILILTAAYGVFFLAHQIVHLQSGEGFDIHFILDITHHTLAAWASWAAFKWSRLPTAETTLCP